MTCRRPRLEVARRAYQWPGTWCTYRRSQYERYSLAVTSDGKVGPSGVVLRPPHGSKSDNVRQFGPHPLPSGEVETSRIDQTGSILDFLEYHTLSSPACPVGTVGRVFARRSFMLHQFLSRAAVRFFRKTADRPLGVARTRWCARELDAPAGPRPRPSPRLTTAVPASFSPPGPVTSPLPSRFKCSFVGRSPRRREVPAPELICRHCRR